jgi:hypothetical protein
VKRPLIGVDRLALVYPVSDFEKGGWSTENRRISKDGDVAVSMGRKVEVPGGGEVFVGVSNPDSWWAKVETNPARIADPDGWELVDVDAAQEAMRAAWDAAQEVAPSSRPMENARVTRIDVARDFEVEDPSFYVRGLAPLRRPYAKRQGIWNDAQKGNAETFHVGSGSGMVRLYDKGAEVSSRLRAAGERAAAAAGARSISARSLPENVLRFEVEARRRWCKERGSIRELRDIDALNVQTLAMDRWKWSSMGAEVTAADRIIDRVRSAGLTPTLEATLLGHMLLVANGRDVRLGRNTLAKYDKLMRDLGIALAPGAFDGSKGMTGRLDFESGQEVLRVA